MAESSIFESLFFRAALVVVVIFGYDMYRRYQTGKHKEFVNTQKEIISQGPLVFDSPLVFVREKPIDPAKL